ncbi:MAG: hypothetical protein B7Z66_08640 [Chromatiales bacterium 21-64-14]|nr:MAG: hypothetical protein B7Z66_08640 [Chromatiales bacterium 21-64-14]HQU16152.1 DUF1134 domain-containing protein [Gammaproteobacteria bacterium]
MAYDRASIATRPAAARVLLALLLAAFTAGAHADASGKDTSKKDTYSQDTVIHDATTFFGKGSAGIAKVVEKAFADQGRPNAIIKGEEVGGALVVGLRYGDGTLEMKNGAQEKVFWTGPSVGFDFGGNASKVYVLVYNLPNLDAIFQRFPAVDGSLYYVAGASINYQRIDGITLAPIRLGVGLRAGVSLGYMHYTRKKSWMPF